MSDTSSTTQHDLWHSLETLPGLSAVPASWRRRLTDQFPSFARAFLEPKDHLAITYPCPSHCGCAHQIVAFNGGQLQALCQCNPPDCPAISLSTADATPLKLSWSRLTRPLAKALGLATTTADFPLPHTAQFGAWSADSIPAILTIQHDQQVFRRVVAELTADSRQRFMLFAPTSSFLDARCRAYLENNRSALFPLESVVTLTQSGALLPTKPPGELFAGFSPQPDDSSQSTARQVFALAKALESELKTRKAPPFTVLLL